jgi:UDP-N-acetylglucosamine--N-acetylmuramyl-(pentapeptide) pyrophosphoryl-undecaprenol N-acetylglucosamine transferase
MEPNAIPGFTHRKLARFVARALVSFPETVKWFPPQNSELTGLPVRDRFFEISPKLRGDVVTVLITGGSQGSRTLNNAAVASWPIWAAKNPKIRLIHQTGSNAYADISDRFKTAKLDGEVQPFISDMPEVFEQADLVVSRSGMGAVSELAAAGKPSILIPLPTASDQHQLKNAQAMEQAGAARLVIDSEWTGERFVNEVMSLLEEPGRLEKMSVAARAFAHPGAARRAADVLESLVAKKGAA